MDSFLIDSHKSHLTNLMTDNDFHPCRLTTLQLLSWTKPLRETMVCLKGTYIPSPLDRAVSRPERDKPAENALSAEIHDFIIDDLACWRQPDGEDDHQGEFSFRCVGVRAYDIGLALVGIDYSIDRFCLYLPQQENGNLRRSPRLKLSNIPKSPVLTDVGDRFNKIISASVAYNQMDAGELNAIIIHCNYYILFKAGRRMVAFSKDHGEIDQ